MTWNKQKQQENAVLTQKTQKWSRMSKNSKMFDIIPDQEIYLITYKYVVFVNLKKNNYISFPLMTSIVKTRISLVC